MAGKTLQDRILATDVRKLALKRIKDILEDEENIKYSKNFQEQLLIKLAGSVLPRLNEHSGEDGGPIVIRADNDLLEKYGITPQPEENSEGHPQIQGD